MKQELQRFIALLIGVFVCGTMVAQADYGIRMSNTQLTYANASAINNTNFPNLGLTSGSITYDHSTKTFTLTNVNATVSLGCFIYITDDAANVEYTIKLVGNNVIAANSNVTIATSRNLTIEGSGSLKATSNSSVAIYTDKSTTTIKNTTVTAIGEYGIAGLYGTRGEKLVIDNSTVKATGTNGSILYFENITFTGCNIISPADAIVGANGSSGKAVMKDGELVTDEVIITKGSTGVSAPHVEQLAVYPNPVGDFVTIDADVIGPAITIIDQSGRVVMTATTVDNKTTLNISHLSTGTYVVRIGNRIAKIIKS